MRHNGASEKIIGRSVEVRVLCVRRFASATRMEISDIFCSELGAHFSARMLCEELMESGDIETIREAIEKKNCSSRVIFWRNRRLCDRLF